MLAKEINFYEVFRIQPTGMLLLTADLEIVDANEEILELSGRELDDLIGHNIFDAFPRMPGASDRGWTAIEAAVTSGRREHNRLFREDIEDPVQPGVFVEHYWSSEAQPIRGSDGHVDMIEYSVRDVTPLIREYRVLQSEEQ
jgi:PAS domain-containing protein